MKLRKSSVVLQADRLISLKKKHQANFWLVIDEVIKLWKETKPKEWEAHVKYIDGVRATRKDKKFASSKDKVTGGVLRYTVDVPWKVERMIRCLYSPQELPMNRKFWIAFARRYPVFKIAERI